MAKGSSVREPFVTFEGVGKNFGGAWVLKDASFSVSSGEVVVLMGENGAGKSTLKNILCGLIAPDAGQLTIDGRAYQRLTQDDSRRLGIGAIHQELSLFPNLSVEENVHIGVGSFPTRNGLIDVAAMRNRATELLRDLFGDRLDPKALVGSLSLGERQLVEVAKALRRASSMLIFDEPTTSLGLSERQRLFGVVKDLRRLGCAIVYVTHFMEEVYELADRVVVLRDGRIVGSSAPGDITAHDLARLMAGRQLSEVDARTSHVAASGKMTVQPVVLRAKHISDGRRVHGVSLDVRAGEIVGLGGLMGAGRTEVAQALFGIGDIDGTVEIAGKELSSRSPHAAKKLGLALVSEDRRGEQIFPGRAVFENLTSAILGNHKVHGALSRSRLLQSAKGLAVKYGVRHPGLGAPMTSLSGGNQQKCVIARWLATKPVVCILDEPTKGIDVGAKSEIHLLVSKLASEGLGVLLISSDLPELLSLSHRILIMHKGRIVHQLERAEFDPSVVVRIASTGKAA